ncbi:MAG TPA: FadR family transcriptional regulator [Streptomyces sp.]|nr:FadR family transcriptional regulator [Streptomyces sp.]
MPRSEPPVHDRARKGGAADPQAAVQTGALFNPVTLGRASEAIVEQVRALIQQGKLTPGDRLPSERALCETFGVSRVTVREALRVLESGGLVQIRVGARGGAFVTSPSNERVGERLSDLLALSPLTASEVTEARMVFEVGILPHVIERADEEDIAALRAMIEESERSLEAGTYTMAMSAAFHVRVAACTHNAAVEMLVHSFHGPLLMSLQEARVAAPLMGHRGAVEHRKLIDAVERRDVATATAIMREHLQRTADRVRQVAEGDGATAG